MVLLFVLTGQQKQSWMSNALYSEIKIATAIDWRYKLTMQDSFNIRPKHFIEYTNPCFVMNICAIHSSKLHDYHSTPLDTKQS